MKFFDDLSRYIQESQSRNPDWRIYFSTVMFAEFRPEHLKSSRFGTLTDFMEDLGSAFLAIDANPNILAHAGRLRGVKGRDKSNPSQPTNRTLGLGDAIHLATCLYVRDQLKVKDIVFHSLDEGKGKSWEGKCFPLIGFEDWFPVEAQCNSATEIIGLDRQFPFHPQPQLFTQAHSSVQ